LDVRKVKLKQNKIGVKKVSQTMTFVKHFDYLQKFILLKKTWFFDQFLPYFYKLLDDSRW